MPNRSRKKLDSNEVAAAVVAQATGYKPPEKNPAAVALGRLGGLKGGPARKKALSASRRKAIAKAAAKARWGGK